MPSLKERIVEILLSRNLLTREQLDEASAVQRKEGRSLQQILLERGWVNEAEFLSAVSQGLDIPPINLSRIKLDPNLKGLISREVAVQHQLMPVSCFGQTLTVAMADPLNVLALDTMATMTGLTIKPLLAPSKEIREAIDLYYGVGVEETVRDVVKKVEGQQASGAAAVDETDPDDLLRQTENAPVVAYTNALLTKAVEMRASDLLIEPREDTSRVRFRVDGVLQEGRALPRRLHAAVISRLKVMSDLNIAEQRLPQDGHFNFRVEERAVDFRLSIIPSVFGGNVCVRILDTGEIRLNLDALGFSPADLERLKACAARPHGMILATGPTGSGKTTTLYALLKLIDSPEKNIVTVEDPVEFGLEGINQVTARFDIGLTFAKALRSILRQDPDVIMVGEIRDAETADIAVKAALTGHLVFSTLHTNSAAGAVVRLLNMGVEPFLINSCLMAVVGQRLVRKICRKCLETFQLPKGVAAKFGLVDGQGQPLEIARGAGCRSCLTSGYAGREVIAETMVITPEVRELILRRSPQRDIEQLAYRQGMRALRQHGFEKVTQRVTTLEEIFRTTIGETVG